MRLQPLRKDDFTADQDDVFTALVGPAGGRSEALVLNDTGVVRGPFAVLLHHPASGKPLQELGAVLRFSGSLPDRAREAVILLVAAHCDSEFEWWAHEPIARRAGMHDDELAALRGGTDVTFAEPVDRAAYDAARAIVTRGDLTDDEYARVQAVLGDEQLIEVTALVGYYSLLAMQMRVFRVPGPPTT